jgi:hypothetical protein
VAVAVAVAVFVGVGDGEPHVVAVYLTLSPFVSVAVPHEKVVAGPVELACTPLVSSRPLSLVAP